MRCGVWSSHMCTFTQVCGFRSEQWRIGRLPGIIFTVSMYWLTDKHQSTYFHCRGSLSTTPPCVEKWSAAILGGAGAKPQDGRKSRLKGRSRNVLSSFIVTAREDIFQHFPAITNVIKSVRSWCRHLKKGAAGPWRSLLCALTSTMFWFALGSELCATGKRLLVTFTLQTWVILIFFLNYQQQMSQLLLRP